MHDARPSTGGTSGRSTDAGRPTVSNVTIPAHQASSLRRWNLGASVAHGASSVAMVALAGDLSLPVTAVDRAGPPGTPLTDASIVTVGSLRLTPLIVSFSLLSALFHLIVSLPPGHRRYLDELAHGRNRFRWVEYALSSTVMLVAIMLVAGIGDLAAIIGVASANVAMILFGWVMEVVNPPGQRVWWAPFVFGSIAGAGPWIAFAATLAVTVARTDTGPPTFVYGILVSIFVLFNCFALNQWLQYRRRGRWADYFHGERVYIVLSFAAKTALAWQVYANVLAG